MADAVTTSTIIDGAKNLVMKFTNVSDGTGESSVTKVDVSAHSCDRVQIMEIMYDVHPPMAVRMIWGNTGTVNTIADLQGSNTLNFRRFGGIKYPTGATSGILPDIAFTTRFQAGGGTTNSGYTIVS